MRARRNSSRARSLGTVSPQVLTRDPLRPDRRPRRARPQRACVLFSDIRGFTKRGEAMQPEQLVAMLNRYFSVMSEVVHKHHGTVDKFIGDGLMAIFGAPEAARVPGAQRARGGAGDDRAPRRGERRARARRARSRSRSASACTPGEIVVGDIGSRERHNYTAIGDVVNVASRLEGLSKTAGHLIICSKAVVQALGFPQMLSSLGETPGRRAFAAEIYGWNPAVLRHGMKRRLT